MGKERIRNKVIDYRKKNCERYVQNGILFNGYGQRVVEDPAKPNVRNINHLITEDMFLDLLSKRLQRTYGKYAEIFKSADAITVYGRDNAIRSSSSIKFLYSWFLSGKSIEFIAERL